MLKHHILIVFRGLRKYRSTFFINLLGLSSGLACAFFIYLWVNDELKFDKFHKKDKQLYQVLGLSKENNQLVVHEHTQGMLAETMQRDLPEVVSAVPVMDLVKENMVSTVRVDAKTLRSAGIFAGKRLFNIFSFDLLQGRADQVLADKNSIAISESLATALFGSAEGAVGKTIEWELTGVKKQVAVSGVFAKPPANSSLQFDFVLTWDLLAEDIWTNAKYWWNEGALTYLELKEGTDPVAFNQKINGFVKKYYPETIFTQFARPYSGAYLYGKYENGVQSGGRIEYVRLFSLVAVFILVIACINFMNLSTARASRRLKEVGIKKTLGSSRRTLIVQFITEAMMVSLLSLVLAAILAVLLLPVFNEITGKQLTIEFSSRLAMLILGVTLLTGLLSGSYPAFYLSGFNPIGVLKGKIKNSWGELFVRKGLVVFQFTISMILIVAVIVIYKQINFIQSANPGYNKDNVIYFDKEGKVNQNTAAFLTELRRIPGVVNASMIQENIVYKGGGSSTYGIDWPGKTGKESIDFVVRAVDFGMIETLGLQIKEGRSFSKEFGAEDKKVIINEEAARLMGFKSPVGQTIKFWNNEMTIAGVLKDFHISTFHERVYPAIFYYNPSNTYMTMVKISAGKERETLSRIESFYKTFNPGYIFDYKFLDNTYQAQYVAEKQVSLLSQCFAVLAILISCLGLFGLAAFNAEIRTKEIGVRKVMGASISQVVFLLSKNFFKLVIIAACIAFPLAWWAMNSWLDGFAYKTNIGFTVFVIALVVVVLLTALTVLSQAIKVGIANPVKSLRTE